MEFGLLKNENPLQGSCIVRWLTDTVEEAVLEEFERLPSLAQHPIARKLSKFLLALIRPDQGRVDDQAEVPPDSKPSAKMSPG